MRAGRLAAENYRGVPVPRTLGLWFGAIAVLATAVVPARVDRASLGLLGGGLLVLAAGLVDDLAPIGPRGLRNHLRALGQGQMTTGALKLIVAAGAASVTVALQEQTGAWSRVAGVVLLAGATNVWNGLDVRPGRAIKAFLVVAAPCLALLPRTSSLVPPVLGAVAAGAPVALAADLRERAMLGDGGATFLGFVAGAVAYRVLPEAGVVAAAVGVVALNVLADTVGFSRIIAATPPLRWLDGLGRLRDP